MIVLMKMIVLTKMIVLVKMRMQGLMWRRLTLQLMLMGWRKHSTSISLCRLLQQS